jgi:hypothetical protein
LACRSPQDCAALGWMDLVYLAFRR